MFIKCFPINLKLKLKYSPFRMLTYLLINVILTGHITSYHIFAILLFQGGDLVSLLTYEGTILYQSVSCFSGKNDHWYFSTNIARLPRTAHTNTSAPQKRKRSRSRSRPRARGHNQVQCPRETNNHPRQQTTNPTTTSQPTASTSQPQT